MPVRSERMIVESVGEAVGTSSERNLRACFNFAFAFGGPRPSDGHGCRSTAVGRSISVCRRASWGSSGVSLGCGI